VPLFSEIEQATLLALAGRMTREVFRAGQELCREGEPGDRMFVISSGEVSVERAGELGAGVTIARLSRGETAGEMCLLGEAVRSVTLRASVDAEAWVLDHATFQGLLAHDCALARALLARLSRHLRRETSTIARLLSPGVDNRFRVALFDSKPYTEEVFRRRNRQGFDLQFLEPRLTQETTSLAAGCQAVCAFVNDALSADVIGDLSALGVGMIALRCAGYNNVDLAACRRWGLSVARVPSYSPHAVAEHAVALMLALNRNIHRAHARVRDGNFSLSGLVGFDMHGKTVGIVGTGRIGRVLLEIMAGFGCRLLAFDTRPDPELARRFGVGFVPLEDLFAQSDIVSLHAPLMPATQRMVNADVIARMKRGAMLINTSRGGLVDTAALLEGLKSGQIGSAGLDVYEEESDYFFEDRSDSIIRDDLLARLLTFPNVIVTSHQGFLTREALENIADTTLANLREYQLGRRGDALTHHVA
jgi:D-lactate dehydrogenase